MARRYTRKDRDSHLIRGLKIVHIGQDVWKIGKTSIVDDKRHQVIYGPHSKEYHVWGSDVDKLESHIQGDDPSYDSYTIDKHGNCADEAKVKIHILTSILDLHSNWCFDLLNKPITGSTVKVIYENGTVKNIKFNGEFEGVVIGKSPTDTDNPKFNWELKYYERTVKPVAYRIRNDKA